LCVQCKVCHQNAQTLRQCARGSKSDITLCECLPSFYGNGVTSCTPCPICHPTTQYLPVPCSNRILNPNSLTPCTCIPGTFSFLPSATVCVQCSAGLYQSSAGSTTCIACEAGKTSLENKGIKCI
jgi:hypothetical protein